MSVDAPEFFYNIPEVEPISLLSLFDSFEAQTSDVHKKLRDPLRS
jgi:hypothetical protein